jgi:dolichyl-phosphate beta-glucosyltransferase
MQIHDDINTNNLLTALIIPFYNEVNRFDFDDLDELARNSMDLLHIYLVDDGSTDELPKLIERFVSKSNNKNIFLLSTRENLGKANAIRYGFNKIPNLQNRYKFIGFTDADFSSPPSEIIRLAELNIKQKQDIVAGVRISTGQNNVRTTRYRYLQGKLFSFLVLTILGGKFLDSQCGLKFMKISRETISVFENNFMNDWLIDLEILCRLKKLQKVEIVEVVLREWIHKENSKTSFRDLPRVLKSLFKLRNEYGNLSDVTFDASHRNQQGF